MHSEVYQKILDSNVKFLLEYVIQMGTRNADAIGNIRDSDSLHIHFTNVINCKIYIGIITITGLFLTGFESGRVMMLGKDGK